VRRFAALYRDLDASTSTLRKRAAMVEYFRSAPPADAAWALRFLSGWKLARIANGRELRDWVAEASGLAAWLVDECIAQVGDLGEAATLLVDEPAAQARSDRPLSAWVETVLLPVAGADPARRRDAVMQAWRELPADERLVFNKLITGSLRVGVSQRAVQQALAELSGLDIGLVAQRMMGPWMPDEGALARLLAPADAAVEPAQPYPFFLASPLEQPPDSLGHIDEWLLEWKWDGIRLQVLKRGGSPALWSRGEERLDGRFPEIERAAARLPDGCVLDGELLAWSDEAGLLPFSALQRRIGRLKPGPKLLAEVPMRVQGVDLLDLDGRARRGEPLHARCERLQALLDATAEPRLQLSPRVQALDWADAAVLREGSRVSGVEGLMLKRLASPYQVGRRRGDWWKWKSDPLTIDAVLVYAQVGSGRRSTLFTDYTFAVWDGDALVPVAKAYSGLTDAEIARLDRWIRANTLERFGPVRSVQPVQVFELGFEGVNASTRHRSGVAVRFPRILRWREDKPAAEADRLEALRALAR
jgi:DNA ligase-1